MRENSVSESTLKNREMQWRCYLRACNEFGWSPLPCNVNQACLYVTFLSDTLQYTSIVAYYQAVIFFHVCEGLPPTRLSNPVLLATMNGIKRLGASAPRGKDPMFPSHLKEIARVVDYTDIIEILVFVAVLLLFRSLLRVSHVIDSAHTLLRSDVKFNEQGCIILIRSSKTHRKGSDNFCIPIAIGRDRSICAARHLKTMFNRLPMHPSAPLFSAVGVPALTYSRFSKKFSALISKAGLKGNFASHSLRRGGATFMSMQKCDVAEIKARGRWASDCVFRYIKPPLSHLAKVDRKVADKC